jgi:hypothetical protein
MFIARRDEVTILHSWDRTGTHMILGECIPSEGILCEVSRDELPSIDRHRREILIIGNIGF